MAQIVEMHDGVSRRIDILDPVCGSGRLLMAAANEFRKKHNHYGIDIDSACVKMAAINMFLDGISGEVW